MKKKKALFWRKTDDAVRCELCPQLCTIDENNVGLCLVRKNINNELFTLSYGRISSKALDPIEKKPLYRFHPGSTILSVGGVGCNLGCPFCQNYRISHPKEFSLQGDEEEAMADITGFLPVDELLKEALDAKSYGNIGVAYTYNEPFMSYEYLLDACQKIKEQGLKNVLVTNGYYNPKPFNKLLPYIDAMNIDLKGFTDDVYKQLEAHLGPVKKTIQTAAQSCHVEVTTLLVPGLNDDEEQIEKMVSWLADEIDSSIPLHISRYFPAREYKAEPTPIETMKKAEEIAKQKLKYVYLGNI